MAIASSIRSVAAVSSPRNVSALPSANKPAARATLSPDCSASSTIRAPRSETRCHSALTVAALVKPDIDESSSPVSPRARPSSAARSYAFTAAGETMPAFIISDSASRFWTRSSFRSRSAPAGICSISSRARRRCSSAVS